MPKREAMKRAKPKVEAVKMWAIFENGKLEKRIDGTLELFRSRQQAKYIVQDVTDSGFDADGVTIKPVLVTPLGKEK